MAELKLDVIRRVQPIAAAQRAQPPAATAARDSGSLITTTASSSSFSSSSSSRAASSRTFGFSARLLSPPLLLQHDIYVSCPKLLRDGRWELHLGCHEVRLLRDIFSFGLETDREAASHRPSAPDVETMTRSRKELADGKAVEPALGPGGATAVSSRLPTLVRFPLLVILNLSLSAILYSASSVVTAGDLSSVSRSINEWWEISALVGFKTLELAVGWWGQFDGYDLAALTLLTHFPPFFLLSAFYSIRPSTLFACVGIDVLSALIPFHLLRPLSAAHAPNAPARSIANRSIVTDMSVQVYITLLGASVYTLFLAGALYTWLPTHLVTHFDALSSLEFAHSPLLLPSLFVALVPCGVAAKIFLFTPSTSARSDLGDVRRRSFNPQTASLAATVEWNFWGYSKRARVLLARTALLTALTATNTFLHSYVTVKGAEPWGAGGWAAVWALASAGVGAAYLWVADVKEVKN